VLLSACGTQVSIEPTPAPTTGQLSGQVFWTGDKKPAENITVCLNKPITDAAKDTNLESLDCKIDAEGNYSFSDIKPGVYMVTLWWIDDAGMPSEAQNGFSVGAPGITSDDSGFVTSFSGYTDEGGWAYAIDFGTITINAGDNIIQNIEFTLN
jgi:hypothetical protein